MSGSREGTVFWKQEWVESLRGHLAAGLSAAMAAAEVNSEFRTTFTRCSVIGKARREKMPLAPPKIAAVRRPKLPRKPRTTPDQRPDIAVRKAASACKAAPASFVLRPDPRPGHVPLLDLVPDGCKWPSGDGPFLFCNEPQEPGQVYCPDHCALAYRALEPRRHRN